jgi:flagellar hook protein FlgE
MDTTFVDLIPDASPSKQTAGNIVSSSRPTNRVQGDVQSASIGTFMAINGDGFFVVQKPGSFVDNRPVFDGIDLYTRRGDFQTDKNGFLVNGAGYYLMGIPVDPTTGNLVGSVPELLQFQSDFLPAQATSVVEYRANVASYPLTPSHDKDVPRSELLNLPDYASNPLTGPNAPAKIIGAGATILNDALAVVTGTADIVGPVYASAGGTLMLGTTAVTINPGDDEIDVRDAINLLTGTHGVVAAIVGNNLQLSGNGFDFPVNIAAGSTGSLLTELGLTVGVTQPVNLMTQAVVTAGETLTIQIGANPALNITFGTGANTGSRAELVTALSGLAGGTATLDLNGNITITATGSTEADVITVGGTVTHGNFGLQVLTGYPKNGTVRAVDLDTFIEDSIGGGAITAFDIAGSPVNIQLRWAKVTSALYPPEVDMWNLFYQVNSTASGNQAAWRNVGVDYTFQANGQMNPPVANVALNNVVINGVSLGNLTLLHGAGGITQFADPNGNVQVNLLEQNGYPAGELQTVAVNDKGRVIGSYSNGRTIDLAEITLANFNGTNGLRRLDGGAFAATSESGVATFGAPGRIVNSSLEGSNTDIADEFTKLIVTQQAYSANTRVVTTANSMVQDLLNMLR